MHSPSAIYPDLRDKVVLITGAAEGIGAAGVELFCRQGSRVIFLDIAETSAKNLIMHISGLEPWHRDFPISVPKFYHCDVTDLERLKSLIDTILQEYGTIDVLINNAAAAGGQARKNTLSETPAGWETNLNTNLRHVFFLTQYVIPSMQAQGRGSIINMGSISWRIPAADTPVYIAAKAAIMGLTKTHSKEFGADGVRVNSIMPGAIATERQEKEVYGVKPEYRVEVLERQTLKRDLLPREVAAVMGFLASEESSAVTGSSYVVDGGWVSDV